MVVSAAQLAEAKTAVATTNKRRKLGMMGILNIDLNDINSVDSSGLNGSRLPQQSNP
jgi:ABC-type transporter Mla MlaB component